jgi:hypothetical protein
MRSVLRSPRVSRDRSPNRRLSALFSFNRQTAIPIDANSATRIFGPSSKSIAGSGSTSR